MGAGIASYGEERELRDHIRGARAVEGLEIGPLGETIVPRATILNYNLIPLEGTSAKLRPIIYRANSLMDPYFFGTVVLKRTQFSRNPIKSLNLHYVMFLNVLKDSLKEVVEIPRDHLKTTVYVEVYAIWRALPFSSREEDFFSSLGYPDLYIEWMRRCHDQDTRILVVSETIKNAIKLGTRISNHYENNRLFRELFFDILPTENEIWTAESMHQRRTPNATGHGEGTFDFIGVGAALQSRHYKLCLQDDLVGREARKSPVVMADTIDYHQVLVGATHNDPDNPGRDFDEVVVGNRWSYNDLNSHIRREEPYFNVTTHSALGGCCSLHPSYQPIYPEAFTIQKLQRWKRRLGTYHFSCQFLNAPVDPSKAKFNMKDLRYFNFHKLVGDSFSIPKDLPWWKIKDLPPAAMASTTGGAQYRWVIRHHIAEGDVDHDVFPRYLDRFLITDPRHSGEQEATDAGVGSRCRHAIIVVGISQEPRRIYLLDQWADACGTGDYVKKILFFAVKWKLKQIHCEEIAAQKFLIHHFNYYLAMERLVSPELEGMRMVPIKLKGNQHQDSKFERIENTVPIVERHELWLNVDNCDDFKDEAEHYGQSRTTVDLLDCFGYVPYVCPQDTVDQTTVADFINKQKAALKRRMVAVA